jgi:hypothetical protein
MTSVPAEVSVLLAHLRALAKAAASNALRAALETEETPEEIVEFFEWRFDDQLRHFALSFADFWRFDGSFRRAAKRTLIDR